MARVRVFNRALNGVGYLSDCLSGSAAADQYEMCKYGLDASEIQWSKGALACLARRIREDLRIVQRLEKRQEIEAKAQSETQQVQTTLSVAPERLAAAEIKPAISLAQCIKVGDCALSCGPAGD